MKQRIVIFLLLCLLVMTGTACGSAAQEQGGQAVDVDGQTAVIVFADETKAAGTVSTANGDYTFAYNADGDLTITYPDGYVYKQYNLDNAVAVPTSYDAEAVTAKGYLDGRSLGWSIESAVQGGRSAVRPSMFLAFVLVALGAWNLCAPKSVWWISHGWSDRTAAPSDLALRVYRIFGGVLLALGILCAVAAA